MSAVADALFVIPAGFRSVRKNTHRYEKEAMEALSHRGLGQQNRSAVLQEIVLSEPLSRTEIADRLGLTGATVSRITRRLLDEGVVRELPEERNAPKAGPGRRAVRLDIDPRGGHVLGIGIGLTIQTVILTDLKNRVIAGTELQLPEVDDPEVVIDRIARESMRLIDRHVWIVATCSAASP